MYCISWNKEVAEETEKENKTNKQTTAYRTDKSLIDFSLPLHPIILLSSVPFSVSLFSPLFSAVSAGLWLHIFNNSQKTFSNPSFVLSWSFTVAILEYRLLHQCTRYTELDEEIFLSSWNKNARIKKDWGKHPASLWFSHFNYEYIILYRSHLSGV